MGTVLMVLGILKTIINTNQVVAPWVTELKDVYEKADSEGRTELTPEESARADAIQATATQRWKSRASPHKQG